MQKPKTPYAIRYPIYSSYEGLSTQVSVGIEEGLKHDSSIHCDALMSLPRSLLTHFIGTLSPEKIDALNKALAMALDLPEPTFIL